MSVPLTRIPVLMYHKVGALLPDGSPDRFISVSPANFEKHISVLQRLGYQGITFRDAAEQLISGNVRAQKQFAVTFDDGYCCVAEHAAPILERARVPATVFVVSDAAGLENSWDHANNKPVIPLMDWEQLKRLHAAGWELAGHTKTHPHLERLSDELALADIVAGKQNAEQITGVPQYTFCYPYGGYGATTARLVQRAGYIAACTTKSGIASVSQDPFLLPRVKISYSDGAAGLLYRLLIRPKLPNLRKDR
jgi:peptidoglycan/xylan/chitin deacetylase (PgdA/CDA1 family)